MREILVTEDNIYVGMRVRLSSKMGKDIGIGSVVRKNTHSDDVWYVAWDNTWSYESRNNEDAWCIHKERSQLQVANVPGSDLENHPVQPGNKVMLLHPSRSSGAYNRNLKEGHIFTVKSDCSRYTVKLEGFDIEFNKAAFGLISSEDITPRSKGGVQLEPSSNILPGERLIVTHPGEDWELKPPKGTIVTVAKQCDAFNLIEIIEQPNTKIRKVCFSRYAIDNKESLTNNTKTISNDTNTGNPGPTTGTIIEVCRSPAEIRAGKKVGGCSILSDRSLSSVISRPQRDKKGIIDCYKRAGSS